jgi:hypothetical protein
LFDLAADPGEMRNLAEDPAQVARIRAMTSLLQEWQRRLGDTQPLVVPDPKSKEIDLTGRERKPDQWQPSWIVGKYFTAGGGAR